MLLLVLVSALLASGHAATSEEIDAMTTKQLKYFLKERNVACSGCVEKGHFVNLAKSHLETPVYVNPGPKKSVVRNPDSTDVLKYWQAELLEQCSGNPSEQAMLDAILDFKEIFSNIEQFVPSGFYDRMTSETTNEYTRVKELLGDLCEWGNGQAAATMEEARKKLRSMLSPLMIEFMNFKTEMASTTDEL